MPSVPELHLWRRNVGDDVTLQLAPPARTPLSGLRVLSWNLAIGRARLDELLAALCDGRIPDARPEPERPLVIIAQEAYRADDSVPSTVPTHHHGGLYPGGGRTDIVTVARDFALSVCYSPSMRNGLHRSDRGNAILASAALAPARTFTLPFARQRRVVISTGLEGVAGLHFASAHLDTLRRFRTGSPSRVRQARALASELLAPDQATIVGADLNSWFGVLDPVVRVLVRSGFHLARRQGQWRHTYHRSNLHLPLDHVLHYPGPRRWQVQVRRLDENPRDRGTAVFGSDHHPLLASVAFE